MLHDVADGDGGIRLRFRSTSCVAARQVDEVVGDALSPTAVIGHGRGANPSDCAGCIAGARYALFPARTLPFDRRLSRPISSPTPEARSADAPGSGHGMRSSSS